MVTVDDVRRRVGEIARIATDNEAAHIDEDQLYLDTLRAIAEMTDIGEARAIATEALKANDLDFRRWYA